MKKKIMITDAIMGSGKTTKAIEKMKKAKLPFIYVTPFLNEVVRVIEEVPNTFQPKTGCKVGFNNNYQPFNKRQHLLKMVSEGKNIVTTHSLFKSLKHSDYSLFDSYILILDEVLNPIETIDMTKDDIEIALNEGLLTLNTKTNQVVYTGDNYNGRLYSNLKKLCDTSNVYFVNKRMLVWTFPSDLFESFYSVEILTYLFEGSLLFYFFKYYDIDFNIKCDKLKEIEAKHQILKSLNIYEGKCNFYGKKRTSFSSNFLRKASPKFLKSVSTTASNLVVRNFKSSSRETAFTTFKLLESKLKGKGYSKGFIPVNERATNKYSEKTTMLYLANRFLNPNIIDFFKSNNIEVDEDLWALSELIQWLWRGSIRNNEPMNIYIPSSRMRNLLIKWLQDNQVNNKAA